MTNYTDIYIATLIPNTTSAVIRIRGNLWVLAHVREEEYPAKYTLTLLGLTLTEVLYFRNWDEVVTHLKRYDNGE